METTTNDEINLFELIAKCYKFLAKKKWLIFSTFLFFVIIGFFRSKDKSPENALAYNKELIGFYHSVPTKVITTLIDNLILELTQPQTEESLNSLSQKMVLPIDTIKKIQSIAFIETTENAMGNTIKLSVSIAKNSDFTSVIKGIENYIATNNFVKQRHEEFLMNNVVLHTLVNENEAHNDSTTFDHHKNDSYNETIIRLMASNHKINAEKYAFQIIELNTPTIPINNTPNKIIPLIKYGLGGILLGILIGIIPLFVNAVRKYL